MKDHLFNHRCGNCGKSYLCADKDRIFCASLCEARFKSKGRGNNVLELSEEERREKQIALNHKKNTENEMKRESTPQKEKKYVDLKDLMYADTFKPYIPKGLRVMRG